MGEGGFVHNLITHSITTGEIMELRENLIDLRKKNGLSQEAVAEAIHVTARTYQNYEYGSRIPLLPALIALADLYQISLDELVGREWK